ncbi:tRNA-specific adenosine deaminase 2-like isoform X2 [Hetaerina americana]|uniref:tRNA-specific adenosine deaminase 2-like isoform X2 n=1 Tax=Hetaerina americana TaxID=62018 RepID=UPI003A7F4DC3
MEEAKEPLEKEESHDTGEKDMWDLVNYPLLAERAFDLAKAGLAAGEVPIGCLFAYFPDEVSTQGKELQPIIIAECYNTPNRNKNATCHAEINAVDLAIEWAKENNVPLSTLWPRTSVIVTVEPCVMCAAALVYIGVRHVRYGCSNKRFGGCGSIADVPLHEGSKAEANGRVCPKFVGGWRSEEAIMLLKEFYKGENPNAPSHKVKKKKNRESGATTDNK